MNQKISQWKFYLVEESPGPSLDDAAAMIRQLGGDPWALESLDCIGSTTFGNIVINEFAATGSPAVLNELCSAHAQATGSSPQPLQAAHGGDQFNAWTKA